MAGRRLLHDQLGFDRVAMTDDLDMGAVGYGFARRSAIVQALQAGNDALIVRNRTNYDPALPASIASWMSEALADGTLSMDALSKSAKRVQKLRNKLTRLT
jgi:beta-N-acetylhexosaminidase